MAGITTIQTVPTTDPQLTALAEQIDTLTDVATFLREHMEALLATSGQVSGISLQLDQAVQLLESLAGQKKELTERQEATETLVAQIDDKNQKAYTSTST